MVTMLIGTKKASASFKSTIKDFSYIIDSVVEDNFDIRKNTKLIADYMDINDCKSCIFLEQTKRTKKLWISDSTYTFKFDIINFESIYDLSLPTNYHKKSGHLLIFDKEFDQDKNLRQIKIAFENSFKSIDNAPIERIIGFFISNDNIHIRHYLIEDVSEIGPRIDISFDKAYSGSFTGHILDDITEN